MAKFTSPALQAFASPRRYIPLAIFTLIIGHYLLGVIHEGYGEVTSVTRLAESWRKVAETTCNSTVFLPPGAPTSPNAYYLPTQSSPLPSGPRPVIEVEKFTPPSRKANAAFVFLARNSDLAGVMQSMKHMEDRFNKRFNYPYVFLNDVPFDKRFKYHTSALTNANVSYGVIESSHWNQPEWINEEQAAANRKWFKDNDIIYGDSVPYRNMCRFNSGFFFRHELLKQYDYYWRIEPDVTFFCDLNDDPFLFMQDNKKVYGFTIALYEFPETIWTLWNATREFIEMYPQYVPEDNALAFLSDDGGETYNNCHFWSNFEIGDLNFWRSEAYTKYFDFLDSKGGFYYERWGDAPVHSIAAALFAKKDQIHFFENIGYRHNPFEHCPTGRIHTQNKCWCDEANTFDNPDNDPYSCLYRYNALWGPGTQRPKWDPLTTVEASRNSEPAADHVVNKRVIHNVDITVRDSHTSHKMSFPSEKFDVRVAPKPKSHLNKFLAAAFITSAALYCCHTKVVNKVEEVLLTPFAPEPKDYCKQAEPFDASNWTSVYDAEGFEAKAAEWLGGAVRIPTESFDNMGDVGDDDRWLVLGKLHKYLEKQFPRVHELLSLEKVNTYGLLYTWKGSDSSLKPMVLMGHQDVVPVDPRTVSQWKQPPFSGHYDGTWIWGRGSSDDKSGLIGILATIESLLERDFKPTRTLVLSFGFDEEVGGPRGAGPLADRIFDIYGKDGVALIVDEGDTAGSVVTDKGVAIARPAVGEKGYMDVTIEVKTPGGHSSVPPTHTSIGILSKIVVDFEDNPYEVKLRRSNPMYTLLQCEAAYAAPDAMLPRFRQAIRRSLISDRALAFVNEVMSKDRVWRAFVGTTQAVDIINGGVKANALPEQATVLVNHRIAIERQVPPIIRSVAEVKKHIVDKLAHWGQAYNLSVEAFGEDVSKGEAPYYGSINATTASHTALDVAPVSPTDSEAKPWSVLSSSIRGAYRDSKNEKVAEGDIIVSPALMSGNTDTKFYWKLTKHIFRYNHHFAGDLYNGAHTANEAYKASGFVDMIKFFTTLIINADQPEAL